MTIPSGKTSATLSFYLHIDIAETGKTVYDKLTVQVTNTAGTVLGTLGAYSNLNKNTGYSVHYLTMTSYIGQTVIVKFTGTEDASKSDLICARRCHVDRAVIAGSRFRRPPLANLAPRHGGRHVDSDAQAR